jgi:hypothetical protein
MDTGARGAIIGRAGRGTRPHADSCADPKIPGVTPDNDRIRLQVFGTAKEVVATRVRVSLIRGEEW